MVELSLKLLHKKKKKRQQEKEIWQVYVRKSVTFRSDAPKMAEGIGIEKEDSYKVEIPV